MVFAHPTAQVIPSIVKLAVCTFSGVIATCSLGAFVSDVTGVKVSVSVFLHPVNTKPAIAKDVMIFVNFIINIF
jgi:hypothetical protein